MRARGTGASELQELYLDYVNNYLTVMAFAADHGMTEGEAHRTLQAGHKVHETYAEWCKGAEIAKHLTAREREALYREFNEWWDGLAEPWDGDGYAAAWAAWLHCNYKRTGLDYSLTERGKDEHKTTGD